MIEENSKMFCNNCGNLLDFKLLQQQAITCSICLQPNTHCFEQNQTVKNTTTYEFSANWKNKLNHEVDRFKVFQEGTNKIIVTEKCPNKNCDSMELLQYDKQMRGADEGSTVFSECPKCGIKFTSNN
mmetsp:Transcript_3015/g.3073  ORF Transcript_3015/g.3073 Transcript_3015/m.3073 type:complete len:127 (+) Transcript_3015:73-453(+)